MRLCIIQGGQTGVDRGAWRGAVESGLERGGWMPNDERDEAGRIPDDMKRDLRPASGGLRGRTSLNVTTSDGVVIVIPDAAKGIASPGTRLTWRLAKREHGSDCIVIDGSDAQLARLPLFLSPHVAAARRWPVGAAFTPFRLLVAGPRASLWPEGEETARRVVCEIAKAVRR